MVSLAEIFDVWYGVNLEVVNSEVVPIGIPFVSRQSVNNGVVCHVKRIDDVEPNPSHTLSIAVSGSVLSTFYHDYEYYSGRDVYIAKPKIALTKEEMLYYCYVIEQNKYRYNYGRGANKTFRDILVPSKSEIPHYVNQKNATATFDPKPLSQKKVIFNTNDWKWFEIGTLFDVELTKGDIKAERIEKGVIPLVSSGETNNGIVKFVNGEGDGIAETFPSNTITFDMFCHAFYQPKSYYAVGHGRVNILKPKFKMNKYNAIFIASLLDKEAYRFSYGRAVYSSVAKKVHLLLPAVKTAPDKYEPDWQFMEDYIKSLPYSSCL